MKSPVIPIIASLATMSRWTGIPPRTMRDTLMAAGLPATGNVDIGATMRCLLAGRQKKGADVKAAREEIDLDNARLEQLANLKRLCLLADALAFHDDLRIAVRREVMQAAFLKDAQKSQLIERLVKIKTEKPQPCSADGVVKS